jgi:hypothetical protein
MVLESNGSGVKESRLWCQRLTIMVLKSNGYGVREFVGPFVEKVSKFQMVHCYTAVALLLHCCHTVVTLLLYCCSTVVTLLSHCCYAVGTLLSHCGYTVVTVMRRSWDPFWRYCPNSRCSHL